MYGEGSSLRITSGSSRVDGVDPAGNLILCGSDLVAGVTVNVLQVTLTRSFALLHECTV